MIENRQYRIFGIRHHGPGSARSLLPALDAFEPDILLVEGPPEGGHLLHWLSDANLQPPVALLVYNPTRPRQAGLYPFAEFSPEWQALKYAGAQNIPARFIDLPVGTGIALAEWLENNQESSLLANDTALVEPDRSKNQPVFVRDPITWAADLAGYPDPEHWWEHLVEQAKGSDNSSSVFEAIAALIQVLRMEEEEFSETAQQTGSEADLPTRVFFPPATPYENRREACMRMGIREAFEQGHSRIAVVCGAWHAPALQDLEKTEKNDQKLLHLPKLVKPIKMESAWVPWDYERLGWQSGYGAGLESPAYYELLWHGSGAGYSQSQIAVRWMAGVAQLLRQQGLDGSPSHAIEAVRLAEALAVLRGRAIPGLPELQEAVQSVFCFGDTLPLKLIHHKLIVGDRTGSVPKEAPQTPLQIDLNATVKRLRLQMTSGRYPLALDLRSKTDLERSHLLHRLNILSIPWGQLQVQRNAMGTFHEDWSMDWKPDYIVRVIEASLLGTSIPEAASETVRKQIKEWVSATDTGGTRSLAELTGWLEISLLADLPSVILDLLQVISGAAAQTADVLQLMDALPPLAGILRYGSVRNMQPEIVADVINSLAARIFIGLPPACNGLGDDAAAELFERINALDPALAINRTALVELVGQDHYESWLDTLILLFRQQNLHGLISGRVARILLDTGRLDPEAVHIAINLALSLASGPAHASAWLEGFLKNGGEIIIYDHRLWNTLHEWVMTLPSEVFQEILPLLRRTFSTFTPPERRGISERVRNATPGEGGSKKPDSAIRFDSERAAAVLPVLRILMGREKKR